MILPEAQSGLTMTKSRSHSRHPCHCRNRIKAASRYHVPSIRTSCWLSTVQRLRTWYISASSHQDNSMNEERCCIMSEITAMTGAPGCTSWIQLQQHLPCFKSHRCIASTYDDNNPIKLCRILSLGPVEFADVTSLSLLAAAVVARTLSCIMWYSCWIDDQPGLQNIGETNTNTMQTPLDVIYHSCPEPSHPLRIERS